MRLAMWSGPRNLSTAMMYAFATRGDVTVWDEPFYGAYLAASGSDHPMGDAIIAAGESDADAVAQACLAKRDTAHTYLKLMPHHMVAGFPLEWAKGCVNVHLIRHPARVVASYGVKRGTATLEDIGYPQQLAVYEKLGGAVLDSAEIRADPERALRGLCTAIGLPFDPAMLKWEAGPKPYDGVWAPHWYDAVHRSTGFAAAEGPLPELDGAAADLVAEAMPYYEAMKAKA